MTNLLSFSPGLAGEIQGAQTRPCPPLMAMGVTAGPQPSVQEVLGPKFVSQG